MAPSSPKDHRRVGYGKSMSCPSVRGVFKRLRNDLFAPDGVGGNVTGYAGQLCNVDPRRGLVAGLILETGRAAFALDADLEAN